MYPSFVLFYCRVEFCRMDAPQLVRLGPLTERHFGSSQFGADPNKVSMNQHVQVLVWA